MSGLEWNNTILDSSTNNTDSRIGYDWIKDNAKYVRAAEVDPKRNLRIKPTTPFQPTHDMSLVVSDRNTPYIVEEPDSQEQEQHSAIIPAARIEQELSDSRPSRGSPDWYSWLNSVKYAAAAGSFWAANTYFKVTGKRLGPEMAKSAIKAVSGSRKAKRTAAKRKQTRGNPGGSNPGSSNTTISRVGQNASSMSMAPIAIGNTVTGKVTSVRKSRSLGEDTEIVTGREFCFPGRSTASSISDWSLVGGAPLSPAAFVDSRIRLYNSMYSFYRVNKIALHYVTSSSTASTGDIMFYYNKDRASVFINPASPNFLPFVLSDPHTLIGPQWQNATVFIDTDKSWKRTDYGMTSDLSHYAAGDAFLFSKTATTDSPGYVLMDYEIEFRGKTLMPRALLFPLPKILWTNMVLSMSGNNFATDAVAVFITNAGKLVDGTTTSSTPTGTAVFDIFKVVLDMTHSASGGVTGITWVDAAYTNPLSLFSQNVGGTRTTIPFNDGTTLFGVTTSSNQMELYPSLDAAMSLSGALEVNTTFATVTMALEVWVSFVGSYAGANIQPNM